MVAPELSFGTLFNCCNYIIMGKKCKKAFNIFLLIFFFKCNFLCNINLNKFKSLQFYPSSETNFESIHMMGFNNTEQLFPQRKP